MKDFLNQSKLGAEEAEDIEGDRFKEVITISFCTWIASVDIEFFDWKQSFCKEASKKIKDIDDRFQSIKTSAKDLLLYLGETGNTSLDEGNLHFVFVQLLT